MITGLTEQEQDEIVRVLNEYKEDYYFYFYGSRVKGNFGKTSDLDIYIVGEKVDSDYEILDQLQDILDDNMQLLFKVNFTRDDRIDDDFRKIIQSHAIPYDWDIKPLGNFATITDGTHSAVIDDPYGEYLLLGARNIKNGHVIFSNKDRKINKKVFNKLRKRTNLEKGDVLITSIGTIGEVALIKTPPKNYDLQRNVTIIKSNPNKVLEYYLYYSLLSQKKYIQNYAGGAVQKCLFLKDFKIFQVYVPPLQEQKAIADVLSSFDSEIENLQAQNNTIEELCKNLFKQNFIYTLNKFTWEEKTLGDIFMSKVKQPKLQKNQYLSRGLFNVIDQGSSFIAGYSNDESLLYQYNLPAIIFGDHTRVLKIVNTPFISGADGTKIILPKKEYTPLYVYHLCEYAISNYLTNYGYERHYKYLVNISVLIPPHDLQCHFEKSIQPLFKKLFQNRETIETIKQKRNYLLPKLIKGQVRIKQ